MTFQEYIKTHAKNVHDFVLMKLNPNTKVCELDEFYKTLVSQIKEHIFNVITNQWLDNVCSDEAYSAWLSQCETDAFCENVLENDITLVTNSMKLIGEIE